ncbi:MAG: nitrilase-related carbon-nitrogen hydrolase [bacterium]
MGKDKQTGGSKKVVTVGLVQMTCTKDRKENLSKAIEITQNLSSKGANIICFQEIFNLHWFPKNIDVSNFALAEEIPGEMTKVMGEVAKKEKIVLILPMFEKAEEGIYFNTAVVIDANGKILGKYRKNHIPHLPLWEERFYFTLGNLGYPVFKTKFATIGIQMCWDNFFPEGSRILGLKGAQIIFAPTACSFAFQAKWRKVLCANAIANNLFVARANRVGDEEGQKFHGGSIVIDPNGEIIAEAGEKDEILIADIDLDLIKETRNIWTFYANRRPETYKEVINPLP